MKINLKRLDRQTIVITGASSGIGLTTAREAARRGAKVVVAARAEDALRRLAEEINGFGEQAEYVVADVSRREDVQRISATAIQRFDGYDTWINNAGGGVYGRIVDVPVDDERRLFEVNYWGVVYGSRIAAEHLRTHGGAIINIGSVASDRAIPLQGAYSASKHAVKAYTDVLRLELRKEGAPVSVTLIKPTAIDTPFFKHAKTYMDAQPVEPPPMYAPDTVTRAILYAAENPVRDVLVGGAAPLQSMLGRLAPALGDRFMNATMFEGQKSKRAPEPGDNGFPERFSGDLRERGNYDVHVCESSLYTEIAIRPMVKMAVMTGVGLGIASALWKRRG
ncbi:MAG TPA: SDR family oxidoreductase [Bryobacteraceae bacterium]|nr:SDR family oxidoreductase [Bryobacteraceae bacterium]